MDRKHLAVLAAALTTAALAATPLTASASSGTSSPNGSADISRLHQQALSNTLTQNHGVLNYCAAKHLACDAKVLTVAKGSSTVLTTQLPTGIGAGDLESAYALDGAPSEDGTITIIDAAAFPPKELEATLAMYRSTYGLPPCTLKSGCLTVKGRFGGSPIAPPTTPFQKQAAEQIGVETSLDVDMASAACPGCKIVELQVPAQDGYFGDPARMHHATTHFGDAVKTAVGMGTASVSISYGFPADSREDGGKIAGALDQPGTAISVSTGDSGYVGTHGTWPQNLRTVIGAGGTGLTKDSGAPRGWDETAWNGAGSSCSPDLQPAIGQPKSVSKLCKSMRADADMSSDAAVQIAVYDGYAPYSGQPYGWFVVGGTSAAAPFIGALAARAPVNPDIEGPNVVYAAPSSSFNDITTGSNGSACTTDGFDAAVCHAGKGWDGPTGLGTPVGLGPFAQ